MLSHEEFGILNVFIALLLLITLPANSMMSLVSRCCSAMLAHEAKSNVWPFFIYIFKKVAGFCVAATALFLLASPFIMRLLKVREPRYYVLLALCFAASFMYPVAFGILQGLQEFTFFAMGFFLTGLLRFIYAYWALMCGGASFAALSATLFSTSVVFLGGLVIVYSITRPWTHKGKITQQKYRIKIIQDMFPVFSSMFLSLFLINADMIVVKYYFAAEQAGFYGALSILGRGVYFLPAAISSVMFPLVAFDQEKKNDPFHLFLKALVLTLFLACAAQLFLTFTASWLTPSLLGAHYSMVSRWAWAIGLAMIPHTALQVCLNYLIARKKNYHNIYLMAACALEIGLFVVYHDTVYSIITVVGTTGAAALVALCAAIFIERNKNRSLSQEQFSMGQRGLIYPEQVV